MNAVIERKPSSVTLDVQEFHPLEDGYAVVKYVPANGPGRAKGAGAEPVPARAMLRMLPAFAAAAAAAVEADPTTLAIHPAPPENVAFMERMRAQERENRARDIANGTLLYSDAICERLGITRQSLSKAARAGRLFALDGPHGKKLYPAFFADPALDRATLAEVTRALGDLKGSVKYAFFTTPKLPLGGLTPLQVIAAGGDTSALLLTAAGQRER